MIRFLYATLGVLSVLTLASCGDAAQRETVDVLAASSLTEVLEELATAFETEHPDVDVVLTFAGSQTHRLQIERGAPGDVFVSADHAHIDALTRAGHARDATVVATNELVVITPEADERLASWGDLPNARALVIGVPSVPIGVYSRDLFARMGERRGGDFRDAVLRRVVSEEPNVRLIRAKVELGVADAAVVYATDARASGRVRALALPDGLSPRAEYVLALLAGSEASPWAVRWRDFLLSARGRRIFARHGFGDPS